jgi:hypothetical protein
VILVTSKIKLSGIIDRKENTSDISMQQDAEI